MKRRLIWLPLLAALLLLPLVPAAGAETETISIPDPVLESAIRHALDRPEGPLSKEDALRLTELDFPKLYERVAPALLPPGESLETYWGEAPGVQSLEGLQHFENLEKLVIAYDYRPFHIIHEVQDLTPLQGLTKLSELSLSGQRLSLLPGLADLPNLKRLNLAAVSLQDLRPLRSFPALEELDIGSNLVRDLTGLEALTNLRTLNLYGNPLNDLTPLAGLTRLESLTASNLTTLWNETDPPPLNLEPLRGLTSLRHLDLSIARIDDLAPLAGLVRMERLSLSHNPLIGDLGPLASMEELTHLDLFDVGATDLSPLRQAAKLESLHVGMNKLSSLEPLRGMERLATLQAGHNDLTSIDIVNELPSLEYAYFPGNALIDIANLRPSDALRTLDIDQTFVDYRPGSASGDVIRRLQASGVEVRYTAYEPFPDILFLGDRTYAFGRFVSVPGAPFLENGRTYVPIRFISEAIGANVVWEEARRQIAVEQDGRTVLLTIGETAIVVDGVPVLTDAAPRLVDGTAYVPVRFVSEQLGLHVQAIHGGGFSLSRAP